MSDSILPGYVVRGVSLKNFDSLKGLNKIKAPKRVRYFFEVRKLCLDWSLWPEELRVSIPGFTDSNFVRVGKKIDESGKEIGLEITPNPENSTAVNFFNWGAGEVHPVLRAIGDALKSLAQTSAKPSEKDGEAGEESKKDTDEVDDNAASQNEDADVHGGNNASSEVEDSPNASEDGEDENSVQEQSESENQTSPSKASEKRRPRRRRIKSKEGRPAYADLTDKPQTLSSEEKEENNINYKNSELRELVKEARKKYDINYKKLLEQVEKIKKAGLWEKLQPEDKDLINKIYKEASPALPRLSKALSGNKMPKGLGPREAWLKSLVESAWDKKEVQALDKLFQKLVGGIGGSETSPRLDPKKLVIGTEKYSWGNIYREELANEKVLLLMDTSISMSQYYPMAATALETALNNKNLIMVATNNMLPWLSVIEGKIVGQYIDKDSAVKYYKKLIRKYDISRVININDWDGVEFTKVLYKELYKTSKILHMNPSHVGAGQEDIHPRVKRHIDIKSGCWLVSEAIETIENWLTK